MQDDANASPDAPAQVSTLQQQLRTALAELNECKRQVQQLREQLEATQTASTQDDAAPWSRDEVRHLLHNLRSPLSAISNWVQLGEEFAGDESVRRDGLRIVALSVDEMTAMLNEWAIKVAR